jgi:hypothetical protein
MHMRPKRAQTHHTLIRYLQALETKIQLETKD